MAFSPPAVYYSRYFIQETLLVAFTLCAFICCQQWYRLGQRRWAIAAGVCLGLMQATKASAPVFLLAAVLALYFVRPTTTARLRVGHALTYAISAGVIVAALFYSSFGTHPQGLIDAVRVYGPSATRAVGESGHEKSVWYYLQLFGWNREGGLVWQQIGFSSLAIIGGVIAWSRGDRFLRGVVIYTGIITVILSLTPYKTPWHAVHLVPGLSVLAGGALTALPHVWPAIAIAGTAFFFQIGQTRLAVFLRPADARNPYAYVHSSSDVLKFRGVVADAMARSPDGIVLVIGQEYWPLPWYLRSFPQVGYWSNPPEACDGSVVIVSQEHVDAVRSRLRGTYRERFIGLRPGLLFVVFTRQL
jgi:uncharacterized protein (TIGR03663 family)